MCTEFKDFFLELNDAIEDAGLSTSSVCETVKTGKVIEDLVTQAEVPMISSILTLLLFLLVCGTLVAFAVVTPAQRRPLRTAKKLHKPRQTTAPARLVSNVQDVAVHLDLSETSQDLLAVASNQLQATIADGSATVSAEQYIVQFEITESSV